MLRRGAVAAMLVSALVVGCSKQKPVEPEPELNIVDEAPPAERDTPPPPPPQAEREAPPPADAPVNITEAVPPEEDPAPDEQMLADADATGLTARSNREAAEPSADPVGDLIANDGIAR